MIKFKESSQCGEVVQVGMLNGQEQQAQAKRIADLQAREISEDEKLAIQRRRAASADSQRAASARAQDQAVTAAELHAQLARRRAASEERTDVGDIVAVASDTAQCVRSRPLPPVAQVDAELQVMLARRHSASDEGAMLAPSVGDKMQVDALVVQPPRRRSSSERPRAAIQHSGVGTELQAALARRRAASDEEVEAAPTKDVGDTNQGVVLSLDEKADAAPANDASDTNQGTMVGLGDELEAAPANDVSGTNQCAITAVGDEVEVAPEVDAIGTNHDTIVLHLSAAEDVSDSDMKGFNAEIQVAPIIAEQVASSADAEDKGGAVANPSLAVDASGIESHPAESTVQLTPEALEMPNDMATQGHSGMEEDRTRDLGEARGKAVSVDPPGDASANMPGVGLDTLHDAAPLDDASRMDQGKTLEGRARKDHSKCCSVL